MFPYILEVLSYIINNLGQTVWTADGIDLEQKCTLEVLTEKHVHSNSHIFLSNIATDIRKTFLKRSFYLVLIGVQQFGTSVTG